MLIVAVLRLLLKKAPKWVNVLLWGLVAVRLVCPFSPESALSLIPSAQTVSPEIMMSPAPTIDSGIEAVNRVVNPVIAESFTPNPVASANPLQILIPLAALVWCVGMLLMGLYTLLSYWRLRRRVRTAVRLSGNIYQSEAVASPFVLGIVRPRIYLPFQMTPADRFHVIAHEQTHIRRRDHWWKPLGFFLLTVHWFNPLMWLAYILLCRDIELACDEKVVQTLDPEQRADYSQALLNCSISRRSIAACPLAFGEVGVKERVTNVLRYQKPGFWVVVICLVITAVIAVCFLTNPVDTDALIRQVSAQDGYRITGQESVNINFVIDKSWLPEDCFSDKGHSFAINEINPYQSYQPYCDNSLYLKHVCYDAPDHRYLRFTFGCASKTPEHGRLLLPYRVILENGTAAGSRWEIDVVRQELWDNQTIYENAAYFSGQGQGTEFAVTVGMEIWEQATHHITFMLSGFNHLSYEEGPVLTAETAQADTPDWGITMRIEEASPTGVGVVFQQDGTAMDGELIYDGEYSLQALTGGEWNELKALSQEPTGNWISLGTATVADNLQRQTLNVSRVYGELPPGTYRIAKKITLQHTSGEAEQRTLYAEFTLDDTETPYSITRTLNADNLRGTAAYLTAGGGYNLFDYMTEDLVGILNSLTEADFVPSPGVTPDTIITLSGGGQEITLHSDGKTVEFSFDDSTAARVGNGIWAVNNADLNAFFTMMNQYSPENSTYEIYNVAPLEELPQSYNLEEAVIDKCVVMVDGDVRYNQDVWQEFIASINSGKEATVRYVDSYDSGRWIHDLTFDGTSYTLRWFENKQEHIKAYAYLRHFEGPAETQGAIYDAYDRYVLTNNLTATWEELFYSLASSRFGAGIDHHVVYSDLIYYPKHPSLPADPASISLVQAGQTILTVTEKNTLEQLYSLLTNAEALGYEPKTYSLDLSLRYIAANGAERTIELDMYEDLYRIDGEFYDYGPGYTDNGGIDARPKLFELLGVTYTDPNVLTEILDSFTHDPEQAAQRLKSALALAAP